MVDILHRVGITTSRDAVYQALTTTEGLAGWWTTDVRGDGDAGGVVQFRSVRGRPGAEWLRHEVHGGEAGGARGLGGRRRPGEWIGTQVSWDLTTEGDYTIIMFAHQGWREPVEFMHHCSTKWATFLMSLKAYVETGAGAPAPDEERVSDWR